MIYEWFIIVASTEHILTTNDLIINCTFDVKQFSIKNSSQYPIYVKIGGIKASIIYNDYVIQANSDFTSGLINTRSLSVFTTALDFRNPAVIDCYDYQHSQPNNTPYQSGLSVTNTAGYPKSIPNSVGIIQLPSIVFDTLFPVYFILYSDQPALLQIDNGNGGSERISVGGCNPVTGDGIIMYTPRRLRISENFYLRYISSVSIPILIDTFYSNILIPKNIANKLMIKPITSVGAFIQYTFVSPPAFYLKISLIGGNFSTPANYDIRILVTIGGDQTINNNQVTIFDQTFTGVIGAAVGEVVLLEPLLFVNIDFNFISVNYLPVTFTDNYSARVSVWDYTE